MLFEINGIINDFHGKQIPNQLSRTKIEMSYNSSFFFHIQLFNAVFL